MKKFLASLILLFPFMVYAGKISKNAEPIPETLPRILVTIKPIHSLVAGVMEGVATPELLMDGQTSPHHHQLKPSEEQKLNGAQVIIWVGDIYETPLKKRIDNMKDRAQIITVADFDGLQLYPYRSFEGKQGCCALQDCHDHHNHNHDHGDHTHEISGKDGHLWLAPNNAKVLVTQIAKKLATLDRKHASRYLANSEKIVAKIDDLIRELTAELKDIKGRRYLTFHDFTQYFDLYFGTKCIGVVWTNPSIEPSPKHIREIQQQISQKNADVLFSEPQFNSKLMRMLAADTGIHLAQLDYLGYGLDAGPNLYFEMMRRLSYEMKKALTPSALELLLSS